MKVSRVERGTPGIAKDMATVLPIIEHTHTICNQLYCTVGIAKDTAIFIGGHCLLQKLVLGQVSISKIKL